MIYAALAVPLGISLVFALAPRWMPQFRSASFRAWPAPKQRRRIRLVRGLGILSSILILGMGVAAGAIENQVAASEHPQPATKIKPTHAPAHAPAHAAKPSQP